MTDWDLIIAELSKKNTPQATYYYIPRPIDKNNNLPIHNNKNSKKIKKTKSGVALGSKFPNVRFGPQESKCMKLALRGKTVTSIAETLTLSRRTVEYYFQKMRQKLNAISKAELIEKVFESDFVKNYREF